MAVFGRPTLLGHRGLGRGVVDGLAENSAESILAVARRGARWVEFDVRRTQDDALVVGHYPSVGDAQFLADLTLQQAEGLGAMTLEAVLDRLPVEVGVNLDVKTSLEDALRPAVRTTAALLAPVLRSESERRPVLVSSFDPAALLHVGQGAPGIPRSLLAWVSFPLRKAIPAATHLGVEAVAAHWTSFGANEVDRAPAFRSAEHAIGVAHDAGLEVVAWCPTPRVARDLFAAGLDAAVVDDLPRALEALRGIAE